jgi:hypothetical protein
VNWSNTSSATINALALAIDLGVTSLAQMPLPVTLALKSGVSKIKDVKLRRRIERNLRGYDDGTSR